MNFITFQDYLAKCAGIGIGEHQAAERLLLAAKDPQNARHFQGVRTEREMAETTPEDHQRQRHAIYRSGRIGRWLHDADEGLLRISPERRKALELAWRRIKSEAEPEDRWQVSTSRAAEPVPVDLWQALEKVDADLCSRWFDDDEEPESSLSVDWRAGKLTHWDWWGIVEFNDLRVHSTIARATEDEIVARIEASGITDQNKFWRDNKEYMNEAGWSRRPGLRELWAARINTSRKPGVKKHKT